MIQNDTPMDGFSAFALQQARNPLRTGLVVRACEKPSACIVVIPKILAHCSSLRNPDTQCFSILWPKENGRVQGVPEGTAFPPRTAGGRRAVCVPRSCATSELCASRVLSEAGAVHHQTRTPSPPRYCVAGPRSQTTPSPTRSLGRSRKWSQTRSSGGPREASRARGQPSSQ